MCFLNMRMRILLLLCLQLSLLAQQPSIDDLSGKIDQGDDAALNQLIELASTGNADAQFKLGVIYASSNRVPHDYAQSKKWHRKAADQGHARAQLALGSCLMSANLLPSCVKGKDPVEGVSWLRKASDQGNALAQYFLGIAYRDGDGVPKDFVQAARWFRKAADQLHYLSQLELGSMYRSGKGVPMDGVLAYMWYNLATGNGKGGEKEEAKEALEGLERELTVAQIAEAQKLSREWAPGISDREQANPSNNGPGKNPASSASETNSENTTSEEKSSAELFQMTPTTFIILLLVAVIPASIAKKKGYGFGLWYLYGVALFLPALIHSLFLKRSSVFLPSMLSLATNSQPQIPPAKVASTPASTFCGNCGASLNQEGSFCGSCGKQVV